MENKKINKVVPTKEEQKPVMYIPRIRSRHDTHNCLRGTLPPLPFPSVVRLGSTTILKDKHTINGERIECNSIRAIENSADKLLMKRCFEERGILTPPWVEIKNLEYVASKDGVRFNEGKQFIPFPLVGKKRKSSRNRGNTLIKTLEEFEAWTRNKCLFDYIIEAYVPYLKEYRIHATQQEAFYACRKALKTDTPKEQKWFRNDSNSVWLTEFVEEKDAAGNFVRFTEEIKEDFMVPPNWEQIKSQAVEAIRAVGLDVGAVDVRVEHTETKAGKIKENPRFVVIETNSAPSFGEITSVLYKKVLPEILKLKHKGKQNKPSLRRRSTDSQENIFSKVGHNVIVYKVDGAKNYILVINDISARFMGVDLETLHRLTNNSHRGIFDIDTAVTIFSSINRELIQSSVVGGILDIKSHFPAVYRDFGSQIMEFFNFLQVKYDPFATARERGIKISTTAPPYPTSIPIETIFEGKVESVPDPLEGSSPIQEVVSDAANSFYMAIKSMQKNERAPSSPTWYSNKLHVETITSISSNDLNKEPEF
ncbi:ATP-grasp domain containing protein [Leptolyngbya phage Lbo-JY46]